MTESELIRGLNAVGYSDADIAAFTSLSEGYVRHVRSRKTMEGGAPENEEATRKRLYRVGTERELRYG